MNAPGAAGVGPVAGWRRPVGVGALVLLAQLWLVAVAGNDIPFHDQWDVEGRWLLPGWNDGSIGWLDLFLPHNEHRIFWTHLLNLGLAAANGGQWDPLVQLVAGAGLHALVAGVVTFFLAGGLPVIRARLLAGAVAVAFLPLGSWHNALWGFQSQVYFSILFAVPAMAWLPRADRRGWGLACAGAALLAMGAGLLVPVVLLGLLGLRLARDRATMAGWRLEAILLAGLVVLALAARTAVPEHGSFAAESLAGFFREWLRLLAWPHAEQPLAALVLNLPLALVVAGRLAGRRRAVAGEDAALAVGGWSAAVAAAAAWSRGGGDELAAGIPSRYVDFLVLLPLANLWCLLALVSGAGRRVRALAAAWGLFLFIGWFGVSSEMWQRIIRPLARERERPAQLTRRFQRTGDDSVYAGQPRLFVPHPNLAVVQAVLADPRLAGRLPPSLQPDQTPGPLSHAVRRLLRHPPESTEP